MNDHTDFISVAEARAKYRRKPSKADPVADLMLGAVICGLLIIALAGVAGVEL